MAPYLGGLSPFAYTAGNDQLGEVVSGLQGCVIKHVHSLQIHGSWALAIASEEATIMYDGKKNCDRWCLTVTLVSKNFSTVNEEQLDIVISEEYIQTRRAKDVYSLPAVRLPDELSLPLGHGKLRTEDLNFEMMINMRRAHQTKHAATGIRTKRSKPTDESIRGRILQEFHKALKEAQDERGAGTGLERVARWHE